MTSTPKRSERTPLLSTPSSSLNPTAASGSPGVSSPHKSKGKAKRTASYSATDPAGSAAAPPAVNGVPPATEDDDEPVVPEATPEELRRSLIKWTIFWLVVSGVVIFCVVEAFHRGGGKFDWRGAFKKAGGGGVAGALAMIIQVLTLMPLRTVMNYQYRFGGTMVESIKHLYSEGGFARYYHGLGPALIQGPIARFGDTAANAGILALLSSNPFLARLPSPMKTAFASVAAALFRMILVPVDTLKTTMQTQGSSGVQILRERIKAYGVGTLWYGAWATAAASFVGSFPWFATYNFLSGALPPPHNQLQKLARQAFIGFVASVVSDTISNSLRVVKTYRQVNRTKISYRAAASRIVATEGLFGLFGRGLGTRILANGLQGLMFSVLWKLIQDAIEGKK